MFIILTITYIFIILITLFGDYKSKEKEKEKEVAEIIKYYEENIGAITPMTAELLLDYLKDMDYKLIIEAIKISVLANKRNGRYINGILRDWSKKGYKVLADIENEKNYKDNSNDTEKRVKEALGIKSLDELYEN